MVRCLLSVVAVSVLFLGCSMSTEQCLKKEGFKSCEDVRAAAERAVGNDEVYKFHTIMKKCRCEEQ